MTEVLRSQRLCVSDIYTSNLKSDQLSNRVQALFIWFTMG